MVQSILTGVRWHCGFDLHFSCNKLCEHFFHVFVGLTKCLRWRYINLGLLLSFWLSFLLFHEFFICFKNKLLVGVSYALIFSQSIGCLLFLWWFLLQHKNFLVCYRHVCLFLLLFPLMMCCSPKSLLLSGSVHLCFKHSVPGFILMSLICYELILLYGPK